MWHRGISRSEGDTGLIYGYCIVPPYSDVNNRVIYDNDACNMSPAAMNFTTGVFNYGDWENAFFMPKPCMLKYDGTVDYYLNPNNYTLKADGAASDVANANYGGNAMMEWPKIYTKREYSGGAYRFKCSPTPRDGWDCWCNYDRNNNAIPHFYTPIYFGSSIGGKLRSISGQVNYINNTRATEVSLAVANGNDWYTEVLADRLLIQDLLVLMAKSTDTQTAYGNGRHNSSSAIGQGTMNTDGLFWGSNNQTSGVKVFGMENWWGNLWRACGGWISANGTQKVKLTQGTHDGSTATNYNMDGTGYLTLSEATPSGTTGTCISVMKNDLAYGRIPVTASGSSSTYEADGWWFNNGQVDYAFVGGNWSTGLLAGAFCAHLNDSVFYTGANSGAALSCKPSTI